ncbi:hypothetical protein CHS0354_040201 [Potamilus streckersoni]|uniref:Rac GTPase-activating protein 1 n=1 Tax=Potamilus streckersoni TaxID=2493646 RepID=A0AAE0VVX3_9BIVA|nr:hypothetical protein CHS0354_040201 [Potamilus streckersoni]
MDPKLSLVAAFDDLFRNAKVLTVGIEPEFKQFVQNQQACRRQWCSVQEEMRSFQERTSRLEADNSALQARLKQTRTLIEQEEKRRCAIEQERDQLANQITLIRELLIDSKTGTTKLDIQDRERLAFLSTTAMYEGSPSRRLNTINESGHSILTDDDIDYDKTEEDLDTPGQRCRRSFRKKRPSAPPMEEDSNMPQKKRKSDENSVVTTTTITVAADGRPLAATTEVTIPGGGTKTLNKSFSEPCLDKHMMAADMDSDQEWGTPVNQRKQFSDDTVKNTPLNTPTMRKASSASRGLNRIHVFASETVLRPRTCNPCGKRIGFGKLAVKCKECRSICHNECRDLLPLPCFATTVGTPGTGKLSGGLIADFVQDEVPMIPGIVIHCVNEVVSRGLNEVGLYRVSGSGRQVKELREKFSKGKGLPNLSNIDDIHVITGCLKDFLRTLKEPLVTYNLWKDFVQAAENPNKKVREEGLYQAISRLPQANRDTMAFIVRHLQNVAQSRECKMPISNLAKVFGPTIVGNSVPEPDTAQMFSETKDQSIVMERLLEISADYWEVFLNVEDENMYPNAYNTPKTPNVPQSMLGPVHTPGSYDRTKIGTWTSRNAYTPSLPTRSAVNKKPSHFFGALDHE